MRKIIFFILAFFIVTRVSFSHKEWVHQHIIWESYKYLRNQIGHDIPEFQNRMVFNDFNSGDNNAPWSSGRIDVAAWREDSEDPLWLIGGPFDGWDPSSTHFWNADRGEDAKTPVWASPDIQNAWFKARTYIGIWPSPNNYNYTDIFIACRSFDPDLGQILGRFYRYYTLAGLYNTGDVEFIGYIDIDGNISYFDPEPVTLIESSRKNISMGILGRVAHLLADMSVPAHVHWDLHPCNFTFFHDGDYYELYLGTGFTPGSSCNSLRTTFPAQNYTAETAANQGNLLYEFFAKNAYDGLKYLYYTTNQLSDHYKSEQSSIWGHFYGNNNINYDDNELIDHWYSLLGPPETSDGDLTPEDCDNHANVLMNFTIRATATLLYWFAGWANIENCCPLVPDNASISYFSNTNYEIFPQVASRYNFTFGPDVTMENNSFLEAYSQDIDLTSDFSAKNGSYFTISGFNFPNDNSKLKNYRTKTISNLNKNTENKNIIYEKYEKFLKQEVIKDKSIDSLNSFVKYCLNKISSKKEINQNKISINKELLKPEDNKETLIKKKSSTKMKSIQDSIKDTKINRKDVKKLDFNEIKNKYGIDSIYNFLNSYSISFKEIPESRGVFLSEYLNYCINKNLFHINNISDTLNEKNVVELPKEFSLSQNYQNPFNPETTIKYALPISINVKIEVYNILGQNIKTLTDEFQKAGFYSIVFDGSNYASGVYFYKIQAGDFIQKKKMVIIK